MVFSLIWRQLKNGTASKKINLFTIVLVVFVLAMFMPLLAPTSIYAASTATRLSITSIAIYDQNWQSKNAFVQGDPVKLIVYARNPSNFPDRISLKAIVISDRGATIFSSSPWNTNMDGNSTPGYYWGTTIPQNAPNGLYYYQATVQDSQGSVTSRTAFTLSSKRNSIGSNPYNSSQCTWKAEDLMHNATGLYMPNLGDAHSWSDNAGRYGWTVGNNPETSSVMVMQYANGYKYQFWNGSRWIPTSISTYGHVSWVTGTAYNGAAVYISDRNWNLDGKDGGRWMWISGAPVSFIYSSH